MTTFHPTNPLVGGIDPASLDAEREAHQLLLLMPAPDVSTPEGLAVLRAMTSRDPAVMERQPVDVMIESSDGTMRLRIFTPDGPVHAVVLRIHGGGWGAGAPEDDDAINDQIARLGGVAIVSPEYRLVPEATIEDQFDDCVTAARWVAAEAEQRFGSEQMLLAGTSAGAHLAAATLLRLRDAGDAAFDLIAGVHLDCGPYDLSGTPSVRAADANTLILTRNFLDGLLELALPGVDAERRRDPSYSPLFADLRGLPPALFTVGRLDPLVDDSVFMAARWQNAGNEAELDVWPEAAHAFTNMGSPLSRPALERTVAWIRAIAGTKN